MSLGDSRFSKQTGGGQQRTSAASLARVAAHFGVCTDLAPNTPVAIGDASAVPRILGLGILADVCQWTSRQGQGKYAVAVNPSSAGVVGDVTHVGTGGGGIAVTVAPHKAILVKCITGGALGTATFRFSLDGGTTWSAIFTSTATSWTIRVLGTYCTLTFGAATYVATKTLTVAIDGTVTPGSAWVGTVTQVSSPIDQFEVVATVVKGGALGAAVLSLSLDNGYGSLPNQLVPSAGVIVIPDTGLVLTCSSTFVEGESYSFLTTGPSFSTSDLTAAITALRAITNVQACMLHVAALPSSAAGAFSMASTLDAAIVDAYNNSQLDWQGLCDCPSADGAVADVVVSGGKAVRDTDDTTAVVQAARGSDLLNTSVHAACYRVDFNGRKLLRGLSWGVVDRLVDTDPSTGTAAVASGPLRFWVPPGLGGIGRDESQTPGLDDVQINTGRTYRGQSPGVYLSITAGGSGWKNLTTQSNYQDAGAVRALNCAIAGLRPVGQGFLDQRPPVNLDGTITEKQARAWDAIVNNAWQRKLGIGVGADYVTPQASLASAYILRSSQLGQSPKRLDIAYTFQPLGEVTSVDNRVLFSGVLSLGG